jgi:ABC-type microcin C transport system permease subunit YejE
MMRRPGEVAGALGLILGIAALFVWLSFEQRVRTNSHVRKELRCR